MALNLMQDQLMEKARWLAREIGIVKDPVKEETNSKKEDDKKSKKKNKKKDAESGNADNADGEDKRTAAMAKRRESVDPSSAPDFGLSPSAAPTRPVSAMSVLPGMAEE